MNNENKILSCDWGTTSFRLRLVDTEERKVLHEIVTDTGVSSVYNEWLATRKNEDERLNFYRSFIQSNIDDMRLNSVKDVPVIISGMASSSIGMRELDYGKTPFEISPLNLLTEKFTADSYCSHDILLVSGLQTADDVMRGEETMLLGCDIKDDVLIIFPGTHSKHVIVKGNTAIDIKTFMTGEIFGILSKETILAKSVLKNKTPDEKSFIDGVKEGVEYNFLNSIFHVRTNVLLKKKSPEENYHFLSGIIIGSELKDVIASKLPVHVVSSENLSTQYKTALKSLNLNNITYHNADAAMINAHCKIYDFLAE